jgi:hypothetical protein
MMLQVPLVGWRLSKIVDTLGPDRGLRHGSVIAVTAITTFFGQILPNIAADSVRVWMLTRLGSTWRQVLASVVIDRVVGVAVLAAIGLTTLLFPSPLAGLAGHRETAIELFGMILAGAVAGLILAKPLAGLVEWWQYARWVATFAASAHTVFFKSAAGAAVVTIALMIHGLAILSIWLMGLAAGLALTPASAAVLFTVMLGVALFPVSISGWGVRELAVVALLGEQGVPLEQALFFSLSFGFVVLIAALPGALVWAAYSPARVIGTAASKP